MSIKSLHQAKVSTPSVMARLKKICVFCIFLADANMILKFPSCNQTEEKKEEDKFVAASLLLQFFKS